MKTNRQAVIRSVSLLTAIAIVGVIIHAFTSTETKNNEALHYVVVLIGFFFISEVVSRSFAESFNEKEADELKSKIQEVRDYFVNGGFATDDLVVFPTSESAFEYLIHNIARAASVKNTVLRYGAGHAEGPNRETYVRWMKEKGKSIVAGAEWKEILSQYIQLTTEQKQIALDYVQQGRFYEHVTVDDRKNPLLQMISITYRDGAREVLFGFHYPGWLNGPAFMSRNRNVFDYFQNYFQANFLKLQTDSESIVAEASQN